MEKNKLVININIVILSTKIKDLSDGLKKRMEMTEERVKFKKR